MVLDDNTFPQLKLTMINTISMKDYFKMAQDKVMED